MHDIIIAGSGLTGLSCAHHLLESGIESTRIKLVDARQELGSPTRSAGLIRHSSQWMSILTTIAQPQTMLMDLGDNLTSVRREWLEKSFAIHLAQRGVSFQLKSRIDSIEISDSNLKLSINGGYDNINSTTDFWLVIDALGRKPNSTGFPGRSDILVQYDSKKIIPADERGDLILWSGSITPSDDNSVDFNSQYCSFPRGDSLREQWKLESDNDNSHSSPTETIIGHHPPSLTEFTIDATLTRGILLAESTLTRTDRILPGM